MNLTYKKGPLSVVSLLYFFHFHKFYSDSLVLSTVIGVQLKASFSPLYLHITMKDEAYKKIIFLALSGCVLVTNVSKYF